jgi:hypothetical protein
VCFEDAEDSVEQFSGDGHQGLKLGFVSCLEPSGSDSEV